jgi:hypothetical protein
MMNGGNWRLPATEDWQDDRQKTKNKSHFFVIFRF